MKSPPLTARLGMLLCAAMLLCVQVSGLHFHRHVGAPDLPSAHAIAVHLWDAGLHAPETAVAPDHAGVDAHTAHSGIDMDIDQLAGPAKVMKIWLAAGIFIFAILWLMGFRLPSQLGNDRRVAARHPDLFVLRPPSNAPPLKLSLVR